MLEFHLFFKTIYCGRVSSLYHVRQIVVVSRLPGHRQLAAIIHLSSAIIFYHHPYCLCCET